MLDRIEFALLKADANQAEFEKHFNDCISAKSICIPPYWVKLAKRNFGHLPTNRIITVCGYPFGFQKSKTKLFEISDCLEDGANEIEMAMNISAFKTGMLSWVKPEIANASNICHSTEVLLTIIIETEFLSSEEITTASKLCFDAGADSIKTNSGVFGTNIDTTTIQQMKLAVKGQCEIKTFSKIKKLESADLLIDQGVDRITTSTSPLNFKRSI